MILTFGTFGRARNANFIDERGQLLYKTNTLSTFSHTTTTIVRGPSVVPLAGGSPGRLPLPRKKVAEIEWGLIHDRFRFAGKQLKAGDFIPWKGSTKMIRAFKGQDNVHYEWRMTDNLSSCELRETQSKHIIARSRDHIPPKLEIFPKGYHMLDTIIMTFVFVDHLRTCLHRKRATTRSSSHSSTFAANMVTIRWTSHSSTPDSIDIAFKIADFGVNLVCCLVGLH